MANKELLKFIKEARARGFEDYQIREPLLKNGWSAHDVENAFAFLRPISRSKIRVCLEIDSEILKKVEKRAEKNMMGVTEQIEDILRRSTLNMKKGSLTDNIDDKFLSFFSRKRRVKKK
ncbi:MAG: hypothetical protein Q7S74_05855 [Nanoarchaeota archaeon]|nr:hypothetical protein [Nanoarchaeota archaeon]